MIPAYTRSQRIRVVVIAGVVPVVIAAAGIITMLSFTDLPDPIAVHWGATGVADGFGTLPGIAAVFGVSVLLFAALVTVSMVRLRATAHGSAQPRFLVGMSVWFAALLTGVLVGSVAIQRGLEDAADSPSVLPVLGVAFGVATGLALIAGLLAPKPLALGESDAHEPSLDLAPDERAVFTRTIPPTRAAVVAFGVAAVLVVAAVVIVAVVGRPALFLAIAIPAFICVLAFASLNWRMRISRSGLFLRAAGGFPRFTVPIEEITGASVVDVQALAEFGGWGVRFGKGGRTGVILRSGEALEVARTSGRALVVTVDDAATAAALVNGLVQRHRAAR